MFQITKASKLRLLLSTFHVKSHLYSLINLLSTHLFPVEGHGWLEPIPVAQQASWSPELNRKTSHLRAYYTPTFTLTSTETHAMNWPWICLRCGKKPESQEKTPENMSRRLYSILSGLARNFFNYQIINKSFLGDSQAIMEDLRTTHNT